MFNDPLSGARGMRLFGLIGYPLSHSFSKEFFSEKFEKEKIAGCSYELFPLASIDELPQLLYDQPLLEGLNVTVPYKKQVLRFLDEDRTPAGSAACNCIRIENRRLIGYNTDVVGFEMSLRPLLRPHHQKALVLGTGGAASAVVFVLKKLGIDHSLVSRSAHHSSLTYAQLNDSVIKDHNVIINTTPRGMFPNVHDCPDIPYVGISDKHLLYDLIYNPTKTLFLEKGEANGAAIKNGEEMLILQAEESWKIWNGV